MNKLSEQKEKTKCRIVTIKGDGKSISKIVAMGLTVETQLNVVKNCRKYPLMLQARDTFIALSKKEAENIMVEEIM